MKHGLLWMAELRKSGWLSLTSVVESDTLIHVLGTNDWGITRGIFTGS